MSAKHTTGEWGVNAIDSKRNKIVGNETAEGWDKLLIGNHNVTVATVYRAGDARRIVQCVNACEGIEDPAAALAEAREALTLTIAQLTARVDGEAWSPKIVCAVDSARRALAALGGTK